MKDETENPSEIEQAYLKALQSFEDKVKADSHIIAAVVGGSLAYDQVWDKSDIDVWLVSDDEKRPSAAFHLVEHGICFSTTVVSRMQFKKRFEQSSPGEFVHSFLSKGRLLFCRDESIRNYFNILQNVGERDREMDLLNQAGRVIGTLEKAQKWFFVKQDLAYCQVYILRAAEMLAHVEVLFHREIPTREVLQQAIRHNPDLFHSLYTVPVLQSINRETVSESLNMINRYLADHREEVFAPVFEYLSAEGGIRSLSDITLYLNHRRPGDEEGFLYAHTLEWLAQQGYVQRASSSVRLTSKSRTEMEELAYFL